MEDRRRRAVETGRLGHPRHTRGGIEEMTPRFEMQDIVQWACHVLAKEESMFRRYEPEVGH